MLTIGIVTVPFLFEGEKKILKALDGADEMKKHVDALLVINNENLIDLYKDLNFFNAFERADDTLANAARSISEIISQEMYINVDFQDVSSPLPPRVKPKILSQQMKSTRSVSLLQISRRA